VSLKNLAMTARTSKENERWPFKMSPEKRRNSKENTGLTFPTQQKPHRGTGPLNCLRRAAKRQAVTGPGHYVTQATGRWSVAGGKRPLPEKKNPLNRTTSTEHSRSVSPKAGVPPVSHLKRRAWFCSIFTMYGAPMRISGAWPANTASLPPTCLRMMLADPV